MKRVVTFVIVTLLLISLVTAGRTISAVDNRDKFSNQISSTSNPTDAEIQAHIRESTNKLTKEQIQNIFRSRNKIRAFIAGEECPEGCTCTGSVTKCQLRNGTREMTVVAGRSGNIIVQTKGVNASTNVELYKTENGKLYGVFRNNKTKNIKLLPHQVREKIRERLERHLEDENISLDENGTYQYRAKKRARLFFIFPVRVRVNAELDPETGKILRLRHPWWAFFARDEGEEIPEASCRIVSPENRDECCQNKNFDFYNIETGECEFNIEPQ